MLLPAYQYVDLTTAMIVPVIPAVVINNEKQGTAKTAPGILEE